MTDSGEENARPEPRENPNLKGQDDAESRLLDAVASGRMPHAWLFTGPKGVGKATLAFRFARYLLAGGGSPADDGPGLFGDSLPADPIASLDIDAQTPVFRQVSAGSHPDLLTVSRAWDDKRKKFRSDIVVDDVRTAGQFLRLTSSAGGHRVVIVDSADEMNRNAANALLKVLEEPPANTVLILVSHAPGRLLPTIRSRCRVLKLHPLSSDTVNDLLHIYMPGLSQDEYQCLAWLSDGSIGRALNLGEAGGLDLYGQMLQALKQAPKIPLGTLDVLADTWAKTPKKDEPDNFVVGTGLLLDWVARGIERRILGHPPVELFEGETDIAARFFGDISPADWIDRRSEAETMLARGTALNLDKRQMLIQVFRTLQPGM